MERMNQVGLSEFMTMSKEDVYFKAVNMVEKYNHLVDICNDSCERIATLVVERDKFKERCEGKNNLIVNRQVYEAMVEDNERRITYIDELNKDLADKKVKIQLLEQEIEGRKEGYYALKEKYENLEKQVKYLEKELNVTCTDKELDLKGHNRREMALVNDLADKNDEIKKLKEEIEGRKKAFNDLREETANRYIAIETHNDICKTYEKDLDYYKNQERIRTDQLRATESKVEELWKEIEKFTKGDDDHGRAGFKRYIEHLIEEEERAVPDRFKERLNKEITEIFTKEEETEVNDIPCGEDAIE